MTVASLWKALDRANCGKPIGTDALVDHKGLKKTTNPWNITKQPKITPPTLAIDLSIWICESLSSSAIAEHHADPTAHLVFTRTVKLLNLGIKLVGVLEGNRRVRIEGQNDEFQKRRSGTRFWKACERCEEIYRLLGLPIVRARTEAEALCALLDQKGIVDGVISNDGDCFLFGATTVYTKFSIENLNQGQVMRYDADNLVAFVDDDDANATDIRINEDEQFAACLVSLTRRDLIAFAILTGSDAAGSGFSNVGCRKALRFIRKCKLDNPLKKEDASMDEVLSWARAAMAHFCDAPATSSGQKCSICHHPGSKAHHMKCGCETCGTGPGQHCHLISPGGKFRQSLRAKALAMNPHFDPQAVLKVYYSPNENQVPSPILGAIAKEIKTDSPDLDQFLKSKLLIRGRSHAESRAYIMKSLSRLLVQFEMTATQEETTASCDTKRTRPIPSKIMKAKARGCESCFKVLWTIQPELSATDVYEFSTIETKDAVTKRFPNLVMSFQTCELQPSKQGRTEQEKRRAFLDRLVSGTGHPGIASSKPRRRMQSKRKAFFLKKEDDRFAGRNISMCKTDARTYSGVAIEEKEAKHSSDIGDDALMLLQAAADAEELYRKNDSLDDSIETSSSLSSESCFQQFLAPGRKNNVILSFREFQESPYKSKLIPAHLHFLGKNSRLAALSAETKSRDEAEPSVIQVSNSFSKKNHAAPAERSADPNYLGRKANDHFYLINREVRHLKKAPGSSGSSAVRMLKESPFLKRSRPDTLQPTLERHPARFDQPTAMSTTLQQSIARNDRGIGYTNLNHGVCQNVKKQEVPAYASEPVKQGFDTDPNSPESLTASFAGFSIRTIPSVPYRCHAIKAERLLLGGKHEESWEAGDTTNIFDVMHPTLFDHSLDEGEYSRFLRSEDPQHRRAGETVVFSKENQPEKSYFADIGRENGNNVGYASTSSWPLNSDFLNY